MSSSTRSGGLFSMLRRAAAPSRATLSLYSSRSAWTRMSTFVFASSTMSTRLSDRSFTSAAPGRWSSRRVLQSRLGVGEGVALDERVELRPARRRRTADAAQRDCASTNSPAAGSSPTAARRAAPPPREIGPDSSASRAEPALARRTRLHRARLRIPVDQRFEHGRDLLLGSLHVVGVRPIANRASPVRPAAD